MIKILLYLFVFLPVSALAQVAFQAVDTNVDAGGGASSLTISGFPAGSAANNVTVCVAWYNNVTVSNVSYAGSNLTPVGPAKHSDNDTWWWAQLWQLTTSSGGLPDSGDVVVTMSSSAYLAIGALSLSGVDEVTPHDTQVSEGNSENPQSITVATSADDLVLDCFWSQSGPASANGDNVERYNIDFAGDPSGASTADVTGSTANMSWSMGGAPPDRAHIAVNFNAGESVGVPLVILRRRREGE